MTESTRKRMRCPVHDDRNPSLVLTQKADGDWFARCYAGCDWRVVRAALGLPVKGPARNVVPFRVPETTRIDEDWRKRLIERTWAEAAPIQPGDPAHRYLTQTRGLALQMLPNDLRFHPDCSFRNELGAFSKQPAMLAALRAPDGSMVSIQRTYLTFNLSDGWRRSARRLTPAITPGATRGAAIRLSEPGEELAIAEGVETALSYQQLSGVPTWSAVSACNLEV